MNGSNECINQIDIVHLIQFELCFDLLFIDRLCDSPVRSCFEVNGSTVVFLSLFEIRKMYLQFEFQSMQSMQKLSSTDDIRPSLLNDPHGSYRVVVVTVGDRMMQSPMMITCTYTLISRQISGVDPTESFSFILMVFRGQNVMCNILILIFYFLCLY